MRFLRNEFALSGLIAAVAVAIAQAGARRRAREAGLTGAAAPQPNLFKVFAIALCASYLVLYIVGSRGGSGAGDAGKAAAAAASTAGIDSAIKEAMRYVDAGDPDF